MLFSDIITLRTATVTYDSYGAPIETFSGTDVFANKKSITRSEFYAANANGIDLKLEFEVHAEDYAGQMDIVHETKQYIVVRTYQKGLGVVTLVCSDKKFN